MNQTGEFMAGGVQTLLTSLGQLLTNAYFLLGSVAYAVATVLWFHLLSRFEFSYVYPFTALLYPISLGGSILFLREIVPVERWIGVGVICIGVVLISRS
jgi:drug/metabolite transporter (DMT)-like permease